MRSTIFTTFLIIVAGVLGALAFWQFQEGNLNDILGDPPLEVGDKIYPDFQPDQVTSIILNSGEKRAHFIKTENGWEATEPWRDRMDARAAVAILSFASTATVEGLVPREKLDPTLAGIDSNGVKITLKNSQNEELAAFRLGRRTPWLNLPETENPEPVPTTYLLIMERGRKSHVYAAAGYIQPLFKENFAYLRDHRPFYFNPLTLQKIRISTSQGQLTLGREFPQSPWRIVKPLNLPTNPRVMKTLLEGLFELSATKLEDRSAITLPTTESTEEKDQIAITPFGQEEEIILEILPPKSAEARETLATVSDRPDTVFHIPNKAEPELVSIADLPLTVNDLRDPTLTNLNIASIRGIAIETATSPTILISREPPAPWIVTVNGAEQEANEQKLYELLKAATETQALSFETDAAPEDLSPWGLDKPIITLTFLAKNNQALAINFGLNSSGNLFAKRKDSATVMRIDNSFLERVAVRPHQWRHSRLWSVSRVDLTALSRKVADSPPLELQYDALGDEWQGFQSKEEITSQLDSIRANFLLTVLENLQVEDWLSHEDAAAVEALKNPALRFELTENTVDEFGDKTGEKKQTLLLSPDPKTRKVYGKIDSDPSYFNLSPEVFLKLSISLLDE
ncbi:MAG: DUF4340 domain-containing protein [Akkermansiaceae bacterium]